MVFVALDDKLSLYSFENHPFNKSRYFAFKEALTKSSFFSAINIVEAQEAKDEDLLLFHTKDYIEFVKRKENEGGWLDFGDTPSFNGIFKAAKIVVGTTLKCIDIAVQKNAAAFNPIGGLHHSYSDRAAGFCVFNDICIGINYLRKRYEIKKILYFDIDAHHGDGVYYSFIEDADLYIVDIHQKDIFPGTGNPLEKGKGKAFGTKLNMELSSGATDKDYFAKLEIAEDFINKINVDFIILQAGCDCLENDPITFLRLTENIFVKVIKLLIDKAHKDTKGKILILGGGGYLLSNIKKAWVKIIEELLKTDGY